MEQPPKEKSILIKPANPPAVRGTRQRLTTLRDYTLQDVQVLGAKPRKAFVFTVEGQEGLQELSDKLDILDTDIEALFSVQEKDQHCLASITGTPSDDLILCSPDGYVITTVRQDDFRYESYRKTIPNNILCGFFVDNLEGEPIWEGDFSCVEKAIGKAVGANTAVARTFLETKGEKIYFESNSVRDLPRDITLKELIDNSDIRFVYHPDEKPLEDPKYKLRPVFNGESLQLEIYNKDSGTTKLDEILSSISEKQLNEIACVTRVSYGIEITLYSVHTNLSISTSVMLYDRNKAPNYSLLGWLRSAVSTFFIENWDNKEKIKSLDVEDTDFYKKAYALVDTNGASPVKEHLLNRLSVAEEIDSKEPKLKHIIEILKD